MLSAMPPLLWSVLELILTRRVDAISLTVAGSILLTVGAAAMGGSARLIQVRDALIVGVIGLVFLLTLLFPRPAIFYLARAAMARTPEGIAAYETIWEQSAVRDVFRWLSLVWGFGLIGQTSVMIWLAFVWPIPRYLLLSPFVFYGIIGALLLASLAYIARRPAARAIISAAAVS